MYIFPEVGFHIKFSVYILSFTSVIRFDFDRFNFCFVIVELAVDYWFE